MVPIFILNYNYNKCNIIKLISMYDFSNKMIKFRMYFLFLHVVTNIVPTSLNEDQSHHHFKSILAIT